MGPRLSAASHRTVAWLARKLPLSAIEFFLGDTCNLACAHCAANSPSMPDANFPDAGEFESALRDLGRVAHCRQVRFLGGEPLLNGQICEFLAIARRSGMFSDILVATNGLLLHRMAPSFWDLADTVRVSLYPAISKHFDSARIAHWENVARRHGTRIVFDRVTHFMEATRPRRESDPARVRETFEHCHEARSWSCHLLYGRRLYRCSRVHTLDRLFAARDPEHPSFTESDGLLIDDRPGLREELRAYLYSRDPLRACSYCLGTSGKSVPHTLTRIHAAPAGHGQRA